MKINEVIIARRFMGVIGWVDKLNFINIETEKPLKLKSYNGCLCFQIGKKRIGYRTFERLSKPCEIIIENNMPF